MVNRRDFLRTGTVTALTATTFVGSLADDAAKTDADAKPSFHLKYAPHFNMFKGSAGPDLVDQLKFAADHGFTAWEDNRLPSRSVEDQERIGKALDDLNMTMGVFVASGTFTDVTFAGRDKAKRERVLQDLRDAIPIAKRVNAKWMTVVPGRYDEKLAWDYQTANTIELLRQCCEILEPHGLVMVLEPLNHHTNHPGTFLYGSPQAYMICRAVDSPSCKILFDVYHQQITEGNLIPNIKACWDEIGYFQAGDNPGRKEPGTGEINYRNVFKYIHSRGFDGVIGMEHGNSRKGVEGERAVIEAYRQADAF